MTDNSNPSPNPELSSKVIELLTFFIGRPLSQFPIQSVTKWLDGSIIEVSRGTIKIEYTVRPEMTNPNGFLHGGIQGTMLDDAFGIVCATLGYEVVLPSIDFHIDYLGTAKAGETLIVEAKVFREGAHIIHTVASLTNAAEEPIANAQSNLLISNTPARYLKFFE